MLKGTLGILKKKNYFREKNNFQRTEIIQIMGVGPGVGATHMAVMIGNYMSNVLGKKVAVVEANNNDDFIRMRKEINSRKTAEFKERPYFCHDNLKDMKQFNKFAHKNIDFYRRCDEMLIKELIREEYDAIILDESNGGNMKDILWDLKIVVCSLNQWRAGALKEFLVNYHRYDYSDCRFVALSHNNEMKYELEHEYNIRIEHIPYEPDPFKLTSSNLQWMNYISHIS